MKEALYRESLVVERGMSAIPAPPSDFVGTKRAQLRSSSNGSSGSSRASRDSIRSVSSNTSAEMSRSSYLNAGIPVPGAGSRKGPIKLRTAFCRRIASSYGDTLGEIKLKSKKWSYDEGYRSKPASAIAPWVTRVGPKLQDRMKAYKVIQMWETKQPGFIDSQGVSLLPGGLVSQTASGARIVSRSTTSQHRKPHQSAQSNKPKRKTFVPPLTQATAITQQSNDNTTRSSKSPSPPPQQFFHQDYLQSPRGRAMLRNSSFNSQLKQPQQNNAFESGDLSAMNEDETAIRVIFECHELPVYELSALTKNLPRVCGTYLGDETTPNVENMEAASETLSLPNRPGRRVIRQRNLPQKEDDAASSRTLRLEGGPNGAKEVDEKDTKSEEYATSKSAPLVMPAIGDLYQAISSEKERTLLFEYISSDDFELFEGQEVKIEESQLTTLIEAGGSLSQTLLCLQRLQATPGCPRFGTAKELIDAVREYQESETAGRKALADYFGSPECRLFTGSEAAVFVTPSTIDELLERSGIGHAMFLQLMELFSAYDLRFQSFEELGKTAAHLYLQAVKKRISIEDVIKQILKKQQGTESKKNEEKQRVREAHTSQNGPKSDFSAADQQLLFKYLKSAGCMLFEHALDIRASVADMKALLSVGQTVSHTVRCLQLLDELGTRFESFTSLIAAVESLQRKVRLKMKNLFNFLISPTCDIFQATEIKGKHGVKSFHVYVSAMDVSRLFWEGGGALSKALLDEYIAQGRKFRSMDELRFTLSASLEKLRELSPEETVERMAAELFGTYKGKQTLSPRSRLEYDRSSVLSFMSQLRLFAQHEVEVTLEDIDRLLEVTSSGGLSGTLTILGHLDQTGRVFDSFEELIPAVQASRWLLDKTGGFEAVQKGRRLEQHLRNFDEEYEGEVEDGYAKHLDETGAFAEEGEAEADQGGQDNTET